ncbi:DUF2637 domain-containing protein [Microbacterium sp. 77mftsu3.1]|uniref:DUF2637 domain-containing protein n=1 Tax=Microbacterium sp. 77mftsu3.1 TaxID=1761802 RepID=UPI0008887456|nr:DUF2637 domain-containing protein [Microbacterium sp. 77mftsu3.1]SDH34492.1 Protein of unknown function [Microbacterium sp. 77mftsu3.1]
MTTPAPPAPRGARVSPDRPFVGYLVIVLVLIVMLAAMAFSFIALYEAAEWTHNPQDFWWLAPVIIDGPILVYTASYAIWRWRGIDKFAHHAMRVLIFFTGLSVSVNTLHVGSGWQWQWGMPEVYGGIAMAAVAPIGALLAAHEVTRLVFMNHEEGDQFAQADVADALGATHPEAGDEEGPDPKLEALFGRPSVFAEEEEEPIPAAPPLPEPEPTEAAAQPEVTPEPEPVIETPAPRPTTSLLLPAGVRA